MIRSYDLKRDPIVEEELRRSVQIYFVSFLVVGSLNYTEYIQIDALEAFFLAFVITAIHFALMVRYRKKEYLTDPSISSIIDHLFERKKPERKNTGYVELGTNFRSILAILVIAYLVYLYAI